jgi:hypothetical protein
MNNPMVMKAVGAMMRGEDPKTFMKNLANTNPQLQGFDLNDLEGTAKALCEKNNVSMSELASQIQDFAKSNIK